MNDARFAQLVKQVKEANDVVSVVGTYLTLRPAGQTYKGLCPFHTDSRPSLDVDPRRQRYKCWSCGKAGDVLNFVQEFEKVSFTEALEQLARRAGIALTDYRRPDDAGKLRLLDAVRWAAELYQNLLLEDAGAESARVYVGGRGLRGETVRKFGLGFAPPDGDWLARRIAQAQMPAEDFVEAGLIAASSFGTGYYDRFRDRVMFPIRDLRGQTVGFGGRILPESPTASRQPKYYNSADSQLFKKGELVYGLDQARLAAQAAGFLAVVEGYTDVLMAHQAGVTNVVATMGTALTADHVRQLRRFAPRVVLVYDADAGGTTGVDRALELFIREDVDLAIATLPAGLDPCDLLVQQGADALRSALNAAADVLDYKLDQLLSRDAGGGVEAGRRAVESVLAVIALAPDAATTATKVRRELIVNRIAHRFGLREATLWERLAELRRRRPADGAKPAGPADEVAVTRQADGSGPADPLERELVEVLLAEPTLASKAKAVLPAEEIKHAGLRRIVEEIYDLLARGTLPDLDVLRLRLSDKPGLADFALRAQQVGLMHAEKTRGDWLARILKGFRDRSNAKLTGDLKSQLKAATDPAAALDLLRRLQRPGDDPPQAMAS